MNKQAIWGKGPCKSFWSHPINPDFETQFQIGWLPKGL